MQTSQIYQQYKQEFIKNCNLLQSMSSDQNPDQYRKIIKQIDLILKHITVEMCSISAKRSSQEMSKLQPYKKKYQKLKKSFEQKEGQRQLGLNEQKTFKQSMQIADQNQKLSQSKKLLYSVQDMSNEINSNLFRQSQQLKTSTDKVKQVNNVLGTASKLVNRMLSRQNRRQNTIKIVLATVVFIVAGFKFCCY